jgi:hypothetical protein
MNGESRIFIGGRPQRQIPSRFASASSLQFGYAPKGLSGTPMCALCTSMHLRCVAAAHNSRPLAVPGSFSSQGRFPTCHDSENTTAIPVFDESVDTEIDTTDPDLVKIMRAWPNLPEPIRRAMLALIG